LKHGAQVPFVDDQHAVEESSSAFAGPAFDVRVRPRCPHRSGQYLDGRGCEDGLEGVGELDVSVPDQELHSAGRDAHARHAVQAPQQHGVHAEIHREDPGSLAAQELGPGRARASRCRIDTGPASESLRYPQWGFSAAILSTSSRTLGRVGGRSGFRRLWVQWRLTRSECQRSSVPGVTNRRRRRFLGSSRASAAITARSAHEGCGRATCRRSTATS
jgi:hypothetical protein